MGAVVDKSPHEVGPYVIDGEVGRGAHGIVYRAHRADGSGRSVALKIVENRGHLDKLLIEPELLSKLHHPGIVGLEDYFFDGDRLVVALEFIDGIDLSGYVERRGALSPSDVREFLRQMASAVQQAHALGVVHRDIKPSNILVEEREGPPRFVLTDFGISRAAEGIQVTKHRGGTYLFMAPEQFRGRPEKQSDLWALGVVAYYLLTRRYPFCGQTVADLSRDVFVTVPKPPRDLLPSAADDDLERLIYDLLEKQCDSRIATAAELLTRLGASAIDATVEESAAPAHRQVSDAGRATTYEQDSKLSMARHWRWFAVAAICLAGPYGSLPQVLVLAGAFLFRKGQARAPGTRRGMGTLEGMLLMLLGTLGTFYLPAIVARWLLSIGVPPTSIEWTLRAGMVLGFLCGMTLPFVAMHHYAAARRIERELRLRPALVARSSQPDQYAELLRSFLDQSSKDIRLHQRVIEALVASGRPDEAAVESQLLLANDPFNFGGSLLLAQSYLELRLYPQCMEVCERYLGTTGYCFEFDDLRSQCRSSLNANEARSALPGAENEV